MLLKLVKWVLFAALLAGLAGGAFFAWLVVHGGGDDPPPNDQDLITVYAAVPEEENGFALLEEAAGLLDVPWGDPEAWIRRQDPDGSDTVGETAHGVFVSMAVGKAWHEDLAAAVLERNQRALALIAEALARPALQVPPRSLDDPTEYQHALRSGWPELACVLAIKALSLGKAGRGAGGVESALQAVRLGRSFEDGYSMLTNYRLGIGFEWIGLGAVRLLTPRLGLGEVGHALAELKGLKSSTDCLRARLLARYGLVARCLEGTDSGKLSMHQALHALHGPFYASEGPQDILESLSDVLKTSRYLFKPRRTRRLVGDALRVLLAEIDRPYGQRTRGLHARCGVSFEDDRTASNGVGAWIARDEVREMESALLNRDFLELGASASRVLLALRAHRLETGKLPDSLAELVPRHLEAVPRDPFDGQPLRYSREKLKVWSVGRDLADQGGGELREDGNWTLPEGDEPTYKVEP